MVLGRDAERRRRDAARPYTLTIQTYISVILRSCITVLRVLRRMAAMRAGHAVAAEYVGKLHTYQMRQCKTSNRG
jgi:hypothetical protein